MAEKRTSELSFVTSKDSLPTVEVDIDSIPQNYYGYEDIIEGALKKYATASPTNTSTIYVYQGPSCNFGEQTYSAFFGVAGPKSVLNEILNAFRGFPGVKARFSDYIPQASGRCQFHVEAGSVWLPLDVATWYSSEGTPEKEASLGESEERSEDSTDNLIGTPRNSYPTRYRAARSDASVGSIRATIEEIFGLPEGSVALCGPDGRPLRADAKIGTLRRRWE